MDTTGTTDQAKISPLADPLSVESEKERKLVAHLRGLIQEARSAKEPLERDWKKWREMYEGQQWQEKRDRPSWRVSNVINVCYSNVETATAVIMSFIPKLIANPATPEAVESAEGVTQALRFLWKKLKARKKVRLAVKDSFFYGSGIMKVTWNNDVGELVEEVSYDGTKMSRKEGEMALSRVSPFHFDPDPLSLDLDTAAYTVEFKDVDLDYIRRRWPDKADRVKSDVIGTPALDKVWSSTAPVVDLTKDPKYVRGSDDSAKSGGYMRSQVKLYEIWVRDIGLLYDADDNPDWKALYEKYANGQVILMAGSVILMNEPNIFDDGKLPYAKFDNVERPDMFWGKSEIEPIEPLQKELNRRSSQMMESANLTADPKMLIPRSSGLKKESITTKPGEKIPYSGNVPPSYLTPPSLPAYVPQLLDRTMGHVERVSGNYELLGGSRQPGMMAASAISTMMEQAEKRPRLMMENLNDALVEMGELMLSRIRQYYDTKRQQAISSEDGSAGVKFIEIWNEKLQGHYTIDIDVGSNLPASATVLFQWASTLFEFGVLGKSPKWLLDAIEWPHRDQIVKEWQAEQDMEQQQQMALAQAGQPPQGPPTGGPPQALPPGEFSMRGKQAGGPPPPAQGPPPPAPPEGVPPDIAALVSQILEAAPKEGMPPEFEAMLQQMQGGGQ
jgi:hypothetical protein